MVKLCVMERFSLRLVTKALRFAVLMIMLPFAHLDAWMSHKHTKDKIHHKVQFWSKLGLKILNKPLIVVNQERTQDLSHTLVVCNHQGLIDPLPIMVAMKSPMSFVSKMENKNILAIGEWGKAIDIIYFDRDTLEGNVRMLRECTQQLKAGGNVLIFPEGTRSKSDTMNPFKSKAFGIVKMAKANVLPLSLSHAYDPFDSKINEKITIHVHPLIPYEDIQALSVEEMSQTIYDIIEKDIQPTTSQSTTLES
jgi:1-acyl-sn-glycerol-3-phosphate acyltransferase